jgi:hypothetical protein
MNRFILAATPLVGYAPAMALELLSVELVGPTSILEQSETQYTCIATFDLGKLDITTLATWSVEPADLATMQKGLLDLGDIDADTTLEVTVEYTYDDVTRQDTLMVDAKAFVLQSAVISGPSYVVEQTESQYSLMATIIGVGDLDVTEDATWSVNPPFVGEIENGLLVVGDLDVSIPATINAVYEAEGGIVKADYPIVVYDGLLYDNAYDGASRHGHEAQLFETTFAGYDIWLGDDFSTTTEFTNISLSSVGFVENNAGVLGDPFLVEYLEARIYDALPNDPGATLIMTSDQQNHFNGTDTWSANFNDQLLPAGGYYFVMAARNDFQSNVQTFFYSQPRDGDNDGFQWNPNGGFAFNNNIEFTTELDGTPTSSNVLIVSASGCGTDCTGDNELNLLDFVCFQVLWTNQSPEADCDANGVFNILDFVCFQQKFVLGCP